MLNRFFNSENRKGSFKSRSSDCQRIDEDLVMEGNLRFKAASLGRGGWRPVHAILTREGFLLLYMRPLRNPISISLRDIHRVQRISSNSQSFAFALIPFISSQTVTKLAAESEADLTKWITRMDHIRSLSDPIKPTLSHDIYNPESPSSEVPNIYSSGTNSLPRTFNKSNDESDIYETVEESKINEVTHFTNDLISFDDCNESEKQFKKIDTGQDAFMEKIFGVTPLIKSNIPKSDGFSDLLGLDHNMFMSQTSVECIRQSESYYNNAFFYGSKNESDELLRLKALNGVYLIRIDSFHNDHYLDVLDDFVVLSFQILYETRGCRLDLDINYFDNVTFLLYHYSFNKLPQSCTHLEIPFGLIDTI